MHLAPKHVLALRHFTYMLSQGQALLHMETASAPCKHSQDFLLFDLAAGIDEQPEIAALDVTCTCTLSAQCALLQSSTERLQAVAPERQASPHTLTSLLPCYRMQRAEAAARHASPAWMLGRA